MNTCGDEHKGKALLPAVSLIPDRNAGLSSIPLWVHPDDKWNVPFPCHSYTSLDQATHCRRWMVARNAREERKDASLRCGFAHVDCSPCFSICLDLSPHLEGSVGHDRSVYRCGLRCVRAWKSPTPDAKGMGLFHSQLRVRVGTAGARTSCDTSSDRASNVWN